jgi:predicted metalloprotease with PDZ domain
MRRPYPLFSYSLFTTFLLLVCFAARAQPRTVGPPEIIFTVSMSKPYAHLLEVEMRIKLAANANVPGETDLVMPVWTPGSYLIREFERHVQDFAATDASGTALKWTKVNKNTWRVNTVGARDWRVTYHVYANEFSVRTNELNSDHAFWNNAALLMYPDGFINAPSTLRIAPAPGWKIATGLPAVADQQDTFRAENFDILYDSPVEASNFKELDFQVRGVPHRIVIDGEGNYDPDRLRRDVQKIVATETAMFGDIPYHDYTFILHLRSDGGGGIEHLNSTSLAYPPFSFSPDERYRSFWSLVAHEFFHLWNVKRIRPDALGPFDYTKENYTKLLWVAEGFTDYYAGLFVRRAGFISDRDYLNSLARSIQNLQNTPGRLEMSVEEASFDAWIKFYRPDENSINSQVSYYAKGAILGLLLDLEIRKRSGGTRTLDDVMRHLYSEFYQKGRNYTPADFQRVCELMAGSSLDQFFSRYVRGREELDYDAALNVAGLRLDTIGVTDPLQPSGLRADLGATLSQQGERVIVSQVYAGSPAYEQGLNAGDWIVAIDGVRGPQTFFQARLDEKKPGDVVHLTIFRNDILRNIDVKLGARNAAPYRIVPVTQPTDLQKRIYQEWLSGLQNR